METVNVKIQGIVPLLQHRYRFADELEESAKKRSGKKDYSEEWKTSLYYDDAIGIYQPSSHIEGALIKAATSFLIPGRGKKSYKDLFKSAVFVSPEYIPHGLKGSPDQLKAEQKLQIDRRLVRVNNSGVERLRPMLKNWSLEFCIDIQDDQISVDTVKQILEHAGRYIGIGDYRPKYGRFTISKFS